MPLVANPILFHGSDPYSHLRTHSLISGLISGLTLGDLATCSCFQPTSDPQRVKRKVVADTLSLGHFFLFWPESLVLFQHGDRIAIVSLFKAEEGRKRLGSRSAGSEPHHMSQNRVSWLCLISRKAQVTLCILW